MGLLNKLIRGTQKLQSALEQVQDAVDASSRPSASPAPVGKHFASDNSVSPQVAFEQADCIQTQNLRTRPETLDGIIYEDISDYLLGFPLESVVVIDVETTGLDFDDEVLSLTATDGYGNLLVDTKVRPIAHRNWPEAQRINGISPRDVRRAPTMVEVASQIAPLFSSEHLVVGYNLDFDLRYLCFGMAQISYPPHTFDVMNQFASLFGKTNLSTCARSFGYSFAPHSSLEDAVATAFCFRKLLCNQKYIDMKTDQMASALQSVYTNQINLTRENIAEILGLKSSRRMNGTLRLGQITRGQNKGKPRYECFIGNDMVGVCDSITNNAVRKLFCIADTSQLPQSINATVSIQMDAGRPSCMARIIEDGHLKDVALTLSRDRRL